MHCVPPLLSCPLLSLPRSVTGQQRETYFSEWAVGIICFAAAAAVQLRIYWIPPLSKVPSSFSFLPFPPPHCSRSLREPTAREGAFENKVIGKMRFGRRTTFCLSVKLPRLTKRRPPPPPFFLGSDVFHCSKSREGERTRARGPHTPERGKDGRSG